MDIHKQIETKKTVCLKIKNLQKKFKKSITIERLNFSIREEEILAIVGPSGCGKSTLLNIISGVDTDYSGEVLLKGKSIRKASSQRAKKQGNKPKVVYMLQKDLLLPWRNIENNVYLSLEILQNQYQLRNDQKEKIEKLFSFFGLESYRKLYPHQLSGGMRQRANFLRTYISSSKEDLILLDEPFAAVDALTRKSLQDWFLKVHQQQASSVLLVTHDIREAILLANRIILISAIPAKIIGEFHVHETIKNNSLERDRLESLIYQKLLSDSHYQNAY